MRILGIVGGIAPVSTVAYYQELVSQYRAEHPSQDYPQILINSIDLRKMLDPIAAGDFDGAADFLTREVTRLAEAGAEVGLFASNTPHLILDQIEPRSPIPLISIVRATCLEAWRRGLKRVCLLGARFIMGSQVYQRAAASVGVEVVVPSPKDREEIDTIYQGDLIYGRFTDANRDRVLQVIDRVAAVERIDGVILGGTELPLLLPMASYGNYQLLDTLKIHVAAAVAEMLA